MGAEDQHVQPTIAGLGVEAGPKLPVPDMPVDSAIAAGLRAGTQDVVEGVTRTPDPTALPHSGELSTRAKAIFADVAEGIGRLASSLVVRTKEFVSNTSSITPNQALRTGALALALVPGFKGAKAVRHHMVGKKSKESTNILSHAVTNFRRR